MYSLQAPQLEMMAEIHNPHVSSFSKYEALSVKIDTLRMYFQSYSVFSTESQQDGSENMLRNPLNS